MDEPTSVLIQRTGPAPLIRIGLVGAAAAALIAVGILAAAASAAPNGIFAANPSASGAPANGAASVHPGGPHGFDFGGRGGGIRGFGSITITAISGSTISLKTADGWTRTITVDSGTTYEKGGAAAALVDLKVGDEIQFSESRGTKGTYTINAIAIIPPHAGGTVSAISGSTITVTSPGGETATIKVGSTTTYAVGGNAGAKLADIKTGMVLMATGTRNSDGSLTATSVKAFDPSTLAGRGNHGFGHGGPGGPGVKPNASAAPGATSSGSSG